MMDKLLRLEIEEVEKMEKEKKERFKIGDIEQVNWALRKIRAYQKQKEEIDLLASREIQRIETWRSKENLSVEQSIQFFEGLIIEYFAKMKAQNPKFKISTPYGRVSTRKQQPKWHYDEEKLLNWLKKNDKELIRTKEEINKTEVKKKYQVAGSVVVTEDGEIVEGIRVEERPEKVVIKTD